MNEITQINNNSINPLNISLKNESLKSSTPIGINNSANEISNYFKNGIQDLIKDKGPKEKDRPALPARTSASGSQGGRP